MDSQLQNDADSDDSSEERQLYMFFRHVCVCAWISRPTRQCHKACKAWVLCASFIGKQFDFTHELAYEHNAIIRAELA